MREIFVSEQMGSKSMMITKIFRKKKSSFAFLFFFLLIFIVEQERRADIFVYRYLRSRIVENEDNIF